MYQFGSLMLKIICIAVVNKATPTVRFNSAISFIFMSVFLLYFQFVALALCVAAAAASGYGGAQSHQSVQM